MREDYNSVNDFTVNYPNHFINVFSIPVEIKGSDSMILTVLTTTLTVKWK